MRTPALAWFALVSLVACGDSSTTPTPPLPEEPEIPRGGYELLVERFSGAAGISYYTMAADGALFAPFAAVPAGARSLTPSPDGSSIAFLLPTVEGDQHLWKMGRDGTQAQLLLGGTRLVDHVAWSADGTNLVVAGSTFEESEDIWTLRPDGTGLVNLTPDPGLAVIADRLPCWSPDGTSIVFQSNRDGFSQLYVVDADGANPRRVTPEEETPQMGPVWSPDGTRIAFVAPTVGIGFVRPDGSDLRLMDLSGRPSALAWTPDGALLFSASDGIDREIFVLDTIGGTPVNLSQSPDEDLRAVPLVYVEPAAWLGFAAPTWYPAARPDPVGVVIGDGVADGRPDVFVLDEAFDSVRVLRGAGSGGLEMVGALDAAWTHRAAVVVDVSTDRLADLVMLADDALVVWRGEAGGPQVPTTHPLGGVARGLAVFDFDRDGSTDLAAIHEADGQGFHMLVHGARSVDGALIAILDYPSTFPSPGRACAADFTGDGAGDVVVLTADRSASVVLIPGQGDITFAAAMVASTEVVVDLDTVPLAADLDGDRRADLVVVSGATGRIVTLRSLGSSFAPPVVLDAVGSAAVACDLDRDGDVDLLVAAPDRDAVSFLRNRGNGVFARPVTIALGASPVAVAVADLDGDAWTDLVVVDAQGAVGVALNRRN